MEVSATFLLVTLLSLSVFVQGEDVILRTRYPDFDDLSKCNLPSTLNVKVERSEDMREVPELVFSRSDVVSPGHHVKVVKRDTEGVVRLYHHSVRRAQILDTQAYHNHTNGACFVVRCMFSGLGKTYFLVEGSIYFDKLKYRLEPVLPDAGEDNIIFESQHVAVTYSMTPVWEHTSACSAYVEYSGRNDDFTKVKSNPSETRINNTHPKTYAIDEDGRGTRKGGLHRYRRNTQTFYIDILPVVDFSTYSLWYARYQNEATVTAKLNTYLTNTLTAVDMRLQTLQLGDRRLKVKMGAPVISTEAATSPYTEGIKALVQGEYRVSAPTLLVTFADWLETQTTLPPYDHAMLFTTYNLVPSTDTDITLTDITKGLANVGVMCKNGSVSLIEDKGAYQSENVAAHELGHGLGSKHDGEDNACKATDRYMMSPYSYPQDESNLLHPWQYSPCSSTAISDYLKILEQDNSILEDCLIKQYGQDPTSDLLLTATEVCEMYYGNTSFPCRGDFQNFEEVCTKLRCRTVENENCILVVPPTGTCCGTGKTCEAGTCVNATDSTSCPTDENCPFGDQPFVKIGADPQTTCDQLASAYCYEAAVREVCCDTCKRHRTSSPDCQYGDRVAGCSHVTELSQCSDSTIGNECCGTCLTLRDAAAAATTTAAPTTAAPTTAAPTTAAPATAAPTTAPPAETTTPRPTTTTKKSDGQVNGFKPDGFQGCYLPPCCAKGLFNPISMCALIALCLAIGRLGSNSL